MLSRRTLAIAGVFLLAACAVIVGWQVWQAWRQATVKVVVTATAIPRGTVIQEGMLALQDINARDAESNADLLRDPRAAVGMVAVSDLPAGVLLVRPFLAERVTPGRALGSGQVIPEGWRAVPVPATMLQVLGGNLRAGDHVDLYASELVTETSGAESTAANPGWTGAEPTVVPLPDGSPRVDFTLLFADVLVLDIRDENGISLGTGEALNQGATVLFLLPDQESTEKLLEVYPAVRVVLLGYEQP